jgi:sarcosine oxidase subunit beta
MDYLENVWLRLSKRLPGITGAEFFTGYAGLYTSTPDLHPVIDKVDGIDGLYICTGFSGHGFKLAPAVGTVMAELILEGSAKTVDISPLKMNRFESGETNTTSYEFKVIA